MGVISLSVPTTPPRTYLHPHPRPRRSPWISGPGAEPGETRAGALGSARTQTLPQAAARHSRPLGLVPGQHQVRTAGEAPPARAPPGPGSHILPAYQRASYQSSPPAMARRARGAFDEQPPPPSQQTLQTLHREFVLPARTWCTPYGLPAAFSRVGWGEGGDDGATGASPPAQGLGSPGAPACS